jgi:hypothetical protein
MRTLANWLLDLVELATLAIGIAAWFALLLIFTGN